MKTQNLHHRFFIRYLFSTMTLLSLLILSGWWRNLAKAADIPYDASEVIQIKSFLEQQSMISGKTNAEIMGITDINDPGKWTCVTWIENHPDSPPLEPIKLTNKHVSSIGLSESLSGSIEIFGFPYLQVFGINNWGGSFGNRSNYTNINVHDNPRLQSFGIKYASVGLIKITNNPKLRSIRNDLVDAREFLLNSPALMELFTSTTGSSPLNFASSPLLEKIDVSGCNNIKILDLSGCQKLGGIWANGMSSLESVIINSQVEFSINISNNPKLKELDFRGLQLRGLTCSENQLLTNVYFSKNSPLSTITMYKNPLISKLDLSNQPELGELFVCGNASLTELLLTGNTKLTFADCYDNALHSLDVSGLSALIKLNAMSNKIKTFSAKGVIFENLALQYNQMTEVSANVRGHNINIEAFKGYGFVEFNASDYLFFNYRGSEEFHTTFRDIKGLGLPAGQNAWKSSFPLISDVKATFYFNCNVHFVSWYESATGNPYDEKAVLSLKMLAGDPIGPTPPDSASKFPANIPPPVKKGYKLQGWYKDMELKQPWNLLTDSLTPSLVLFPNWVPEGVPTVISVLRQIPSGENTSANKVTYLVTFSKTVSGIDVSDFILKSEGTVTGKIASVSATNGNTVSVEVNTISGTGTLRLDVKSSGTGIVDAESNPLSGGFSGGEIYRFGTTTAVSGFLLNDTNLRVFPNPTSGIVHIKKSGNETLKNVEILNIQGKQVWQQPDQENHQVDITSLPSGIYFLKIHTGSQILTKKIIKTGS